MTQTGTASKPGTIRVGDRIGRRVVVAALGRDPVQRSQMYRMRCSCGSITIASASNLRKGDSLSCRCAAADKRAAKEAAERAAQGRWEAGAEQRERERLAAFVDGVSPYLHPLWLIWDRLSDRDDCHPRWKAKAREPFRHFVSTMGPRPSLEHYVYPAVPGQPVGPKNAKWMTQSESMTGERHPAAKLSFEDVATIRRSTETRAALAKRFGVSEWHIKDVRRGRCWKHVDPEAATPTRAPT